MPVTKKKIVETQEYGNYFNLSHSLGVNSTLKDVSSSSFPGSRLRTSLVWHARPSHTQAQRRKGKGSKVFHGFKFKSQ